MDRAKIETCKKICEPFIIGAWMIFAVISFIGVCGLGITQINLLAGILFGFIGINVWYGKRHFHKEYQVRTVILAAVVAVSMVVGMVLRDMDQSGLGRSLGLLDIVFFIGVFTFLCPIVHNLFVLTGQMWIKDEKIIRLTKKQCILIWFCMLLLWMPYYLTFFPGIFGSDPMESIRQCLGMEQWTNHHPILYTGYIKLFLTIFQPHFGINAALGMMTLVQQMIFAGVFTYMLSFMMRRGMHSVVIGGAFLFVSVNPVVAIFSVYATKDVLFSASVLMFILKIYECVEDMANKKVSFWITFAVNALLVIYLRNNGSFIVIGSLLVMLLANRKYWKMIGSVLLVAVIGIFLQKQVVFPMLQIEEGSFAESLSIPLQQVGQAVVDGAVMTGEEEAFLNAMLPLEEMAVAYEAGYTDPIKFHEHFDDTFLNDNKMTFIKVWFGMLPDNFGSYVKGYLLQTAGYWDISQTDSLTGYGVVDNTLGVEQIDGIDYITGYSLQPLMEKLILVCRKAPVVCYLTNMAMMMIFLTFLCMVLSKSKYSRYIVCLSPLWITWGTIMIAAPASCKFRYLLPVYMAIPILAWMLQHLSMGERHGD